MDWLAIRPPGIFAVTAVIVAGPAVRIVRTGPVKGVR